MTDWLFIVALLATAGGYFCAGILKGHRDYEGKFVEGMNAMERIHDGIYGSHAPKASSDEAHP